MVSRLAEVDEFLKAQWDGDRPLLLGYSGGPDSKALLYSLLEWGVKKLHLAHVDHGWREESAIEAEELRKEAHHLGCPFHSIRLQMPEKGNKEDLARQARLAFFRSLIDLIPCQAVLLAHQADDLAETALKRILEGAHLPNICGMEPVSQYNGMSIWRPLLRVRKETLLHFLAERKLESLWDSTNADPAYLRARMRQKILPFLSASFGKQVEENLIFSAERSEELKNYLDKRIESVKIQKGPWGQFVDLNGMERIEQRHLLQKLAREESISIPRPVLETILDWVGQQLPSRHLKVQLLDFYIDRGHIFLVNVRKNGKEFLSEKSLSEKIQSLKISFSFIARDSKSGL